MSYQLSVVPERRAEDKPAYKKYQDSYPQKIIDAALDSPCGLDHTKIAVLLNVASCTLWAWKKNYPEFADAMDFCLTHRQSKLVDQYDDHFFTQGQFDKFYDRANAEHLRLSGYGRNLSVIRGVKNELEAMQKVQDALADKEMSLEAAQIMSNVLRAKSDIRKTDEMQKEIDKMQDVIKKLTGDKA